MCSCIPTILLHAYDVRSDKSDSISETSPAAVFNCPSGALNCVSWARVLRMVALLAG